MKYIKKRYQEENFNEDTIQKAKLDEIKQQYFSSAVNSPALSNEVSIFDKIKNIDS